MHKKNEEFVVNVPLTDTTIGDVLATGSVLTSQLLQYFHKVKPFADRAPSKSLFLMQEKPFAYLSNTSKDTLTNATWIIYALEADDDAGTELNVNLDNPEVV